MNLDIPCHIGIDDNTVGNSLAQMTYYQLHTILYIVELPHWNRSISYSTQKGSTLSQSSLMLAEIWSWHSGKPLLFLPFSFKVLCVRESQPAWYCLHNCHKCMQLEEHAIIIVIMLTGLVMPTLQATNPTLEMSIHMTFFTLWVQKNSYFLLIIHGEGGWNQNLLS